MLDAGRLRDFFGFNRAKHAVVEAAILATRIHLLAAEEIAAEFRKLGVIVGKTGGDQEKEAFAFLERYVAEAGQYRSGGNRDSRQASSRLHFGLFVLPSEAGEPVTWPDNEGQPTIAARHFGGVGLMVKDPGLALSVEPAETWSASGPCAERALAFAKIMLRGVGHSGSVCDHGGSLSRRACRIGDRHAIGSGCGPRDHIGLRALRCVGPSVGETGRSRAAIGAWDSRLRPGWFSRRSGQTRSRGDCRRWSLGCRFPKIGGCC